VNFLFNKSKEPSGQKKHKFRLQSKISLWLGFFFLAFWGIALMTAHNWLISEILKGAEEDCRHTVALMESSQDYVRGTPRPTVANLIDEDEFISEEMSTTYISRGIVEHYLDEFPGFYFKFATTNPRNNLNSADETEIRIIEQFKNNPNLEEWKGITKRQGVPCLSIATPIRFKENCHRCHGDASGAPAALVERYGETGGFGRVPGEVAIRSVSIPIATPLMTARSKTTIFACLAGLYLGGLYLLTSLVLRWLVIKPLDQLGESAEYISKGKLEHRIAITSGDEIEALANGFNTMAESVRESYYDLEHRVAERTEQLETIIESAPMGIILVDAETRRIAKVNKNALMMAGLPEEGIIGLYCHEFFQCKEGDCCSVTDPAKESGNFNYTIFKPDGQEIPLIMRMEEVTIDSYPYILGAFIDITEQQRAEKALRDSEERFRKFSEATFEGIVIHDKGKMLDVNQAIADMLGYNVDELIGLSAENLVAPESLDLLRENLKSGTEKTIRINRHKERRLYIDNRSHWETHPVQRTHRQSGGCA
jgi:PAS domain S-box-containing protein